MKSRPIFSTFAVLLLASALASAQGADPAPEPFVPYGAFQTELDGRVLDDVTMFHAARPGIYLVRSSALEQPLLINVRSQTIERLDAAALRDNPNGTVSLLSGAAPETVGPFQVEGKRLISELDGKRLIFGPRPHLLGPQTSDAIEAHDVSYGYRAGLYPPSDKVIAQLRQETRQVTVRIFFGSWCATCARFLPWLMQVERELEANNFRFEYYGLPHDMSDPVAREAGIHAVPTAVVSVDGEELGRRTSQGLGIPEEALLEMLAGD